MCKLFLYSEVVRGFPHITPITVLADTAVLFLTPFKPH